METLDIRAGVLAELRQRMQHPQGPRHLIPLFRKLGVTPSMIQKATGAKSTDVISNWRRGRSAPQDAQYQRLDALRTVVSYLLSTNALEDDGLAIALWLNGYPQGTPFEDANGRPVMTPLEAIRDGEFLAVVDAARGWSEVQEEWARHLDSESNCSPVDM
jgi:hypothetical protein